MRDRPAKILDNPGHYVAEDGAGRLLGWVHAEHRLSLSGGERQLLPDALILREA